MFGFIFALWVLLFGSEEIVLGALICFPFVEIVRVLYGFLCWLRNDARHDMEQFVKKLIVVK